MSPIIPCSPTTPSGSGLGTSTESRFQRLRRRPHRARRPRRMRPPSSRLTCRLSPRPTDQHTPRRMSPPTVRPMPRRLLGQPRSRRWSRPWARPRTSRLWSQPRSRPWSQHRSRPRRQPRRLPRYLPRRRPTAPPPTTVTVARVALSPALRTLRTMVRKTTPPPPCGRHGSSTRRTLAREGTAHPRPARELHNFVLFLNSDLHRTF
mmetsp:Transcript_85389/g.241855  ORF Transcript_85389/g.241855 Transcript_85389/m.241855 type:complete len:206 (+) Transcript_85389:1458-2075(+)